MFRQLSAVTSVVNQTVIAASDKKMHGTADYWSYSVNGRGELLAATTMHSMK